jgi:anthranilate/para-aminobenzoate synthase component I
MLKSAILPPKKVFIEEARAGIIGPVYMRLPFISPRSIYESIMGRHSFLLESIKGPERIARYSICGGGPFLIFRVKNQQVVIEGGEGRSSISSGHPLRILRGLMKRYRMRPNPELPPFVGGVVGVLSYDFVHYFERLPRTTIDDLNLPDADFLFVDTVVVTDHKLGHTFIISAPGASEMITGKGSEDWGDYYEMACERLNALYRRIINAPATRRPPRQTSDICIRHEMDKKTYMDMVKRAKEYIRAGDIFQANLSQRVSAHTPDIHPWDIYNILSMINPSPFAAFMDMGAYHIVSSSPERLVRVNSGTVETRPIAGTRPRGADEYTDRIMRAELLLDEKERAEHIMLIDLERNDLGKISDYGSVVVDELMITEDYSHVIHIVSNIKGRMAPDRDCFDAIRAVFPGGTITGVPKVRCMEIIDELEPTSRGPYTGSLGYISFTGAMDLNIIIRTFIIKDSLAYVQAGAGIVADSDPEREYYETLKKAEALIRTLEAI